MSDKISDDLEVGCEETAEVAFEKSKDKNVSQIYLLTHKQNNDIKCP